MPAYNTFNLATQGRNGQTPNITTNYYAGLSRPNPIGNQLGNQTATPQPSGTPTGTATPTPGQGWSQGMDARPFLQQYLGSRNPYGTSGLNLENSLAGIPSNAGRIDPRLYNYGYSQVDQSEGGSERMFNGNANVNTRGQIIRNGQTFVQAGEALDRIIDPTKVQWDDEFGLLTDPSNIHMPERAVDRYMPAVVAAGLGGITAAHALGAGAAAEAGGVYGGMQGTGEGAFANWTAPTLAEGAGGVGTASAVGGPAGTATSTMGPVTGPMGYEGSGLASTATGAGASSLVNPALSLAGTVASAVGNRRNASQYSNDINRLVERADTWGPENRQRAIDRIWQLYNDPSSIENTPGYQFARQQGEQGVNRESAKRGYFRSPNMLYDLSKFNQGLASRTYDSEMNRLMTMAGVSNNPASAAQIGAGGANNSSSMRDNTLNSYLAAGRTFWDWFSGLNLG